MNIDEILAGAVAQLQNHDDRLKQYESVFGESVIIPSKHVNAILVTSSAIIFIICVTFSYIWFLDRPI